jgi:hypothetical protein
MSDATINAIWFLLMFLLLIVSCAMAFLSLVWLVCAAAASGVGLMPWLVIFPLSLAGRVGCGGAGGAMRYISLFSGIEAASRARGCLWVGSLSRSAEIEPFPKPYWRTVIQTSPIWGT